MSLIPTIIEKILSHSRKHQYCNMQTCTMVISPEERDIINNHLNPSFFVGKPDEWTRANVYGVDLIVYQDLIDKERHLSIAIERALSCIKEIQCLLNLDQLSNFKKGIE